MVSNKHLIHGFNDLVIQLYALSSIKVLMTLPYLLVTQPMVVFLLSYVDDIIITRSDSEGIHDLKCFFA